MGAAENKARVAAAIDPKLRKGIDDVCKAWDALAAKMNLATTKLTVALKNQDPASTRLFMRALLAEGKLAGALASRAQFCLDELAKIESADDGFVDDLEEIERMTARLSLARMAAQQRFAGAKVLIQTAEEHLDRMESAVDQAERAWSQLDAFFRAERTQRKDRLERARALRADVQKAAAARDTKSLAETKKAAEALATFKRPIDNLRARLKDLASVIDPKQLPDGMQSKFDEDSAEWTELVDACEADEKSIAAEVKAIDAQQKAAPDAARCAKVLGIKPAEAPRLARLLELDASALPKALDQLAQQLSMKTSGKQMLAALQKARLV